ncbi:GNAT family N-acetyltransferase [Paenibacillus sp. LHD-117]|uniref:GNAT family N-acetyltransferase n=1 Tax=Paenibacillus sp. LHD-117 TaxID=3071412 RepID=UPI0027E0686E|nr:GNAT family N-acetyltransferase [Paenibacillus sp. LHD-117]MDQ6421761.1 GNAT family N-acetyltransferase [Paenibacillus sp. LHD-117]
MIKYNQMKIEDASHLREIDRSEYIDHTYKMINGVLTAIPESGHECPSWNDAMLNGLESRFVFELQNGGTAIGAYDDNKLVGFGVLAHLFRGEYKDQLQVDLMYVSRNYRRQGIGTTILQQLSHLAKNKGAKSLYISSTETRSAVSFYMSQGGRLAQKVDDELFEKEPADIHMVKELD